MFINEFLTFIHILQHLLAAVISNGALSKVCIEAKPDNMFKKVPGAAYISLVSLETSLKHECLSWALTVKPEISTGKKGTASIWMFFLLVY